MGEVVFGMRMNWDDADEAQRRYRNILDPGYGDRGSLFSFLTALEHRVSTGYELDRSDEALERFLHHARTRRGGKSWDHLFLHAPTGSNSAAE